MTCGTLLIYRCKPTAPCLSWLLPVLLRASARIIAQPASERQEGDFMNEMPSRNTAAQATQAKRARILASYNCESRLVGNFLVRRWRRLTSRRGFFAELLIPGDVRASIHQSATLSPLSTPECSTGRIDEAASRQFLLDYLPEIAADIAKGTRPEPGELWFSMWLESGRNPGEGQTDIAIATREQLSHLPIPIRWRRS